MKTSFQLGLVASLISAASPAFASVQWTHSISRGMHVYTLSDDGHSVTLACDPDRVFGGRSNATLTVQFASHPAPSQVVLLAQTGEQAAFVIESGVATEFAADPEEWAEMVSILKGGGDYAFVTSKDSMKLTDVEPIADLNC